MQEILTGMKLRLWLILLGLGIIPLLTSAQSFSKQDTLRGTITSERSWWDLTFYHLKVNVNPNDSTISGTNEMTYRVLTPSNLLQIDLQEQMNITQVTQDGLPLIFNREGNVYWISLTKYQQPRDYNKLIITFSGRPKVAKRPPWDGGISWSKTAQGKPFIASSCQGLGASVWWPCKDHMYDEPDSMNISVTCARDLTSVANGRLENKVINADGTRTFNWRVSNPINNYSVNINIAPYAHYRDTFQGEKGVLDIDYYPLPENLNKARTQFTEVKRMLKAFEYWFGPYPFYADGYKLVEVPYLGMEHQSSITYGNGYQNGYLGTDLSGTGWGLKFDFIIVHESGHEWFANSITYRDMADMWIHESFTNYSENLFLEYYFGKEAGAAYVIGTRKNIRNDKPIIGPYGVNKSGSGDMYYKGGNMLHTLRQWVGNDIKWRELLRSLNSAFYHQTVDSKQIEDFISQQTNLILRGFFDQYLRDTRIPKFVYRINGNKVEFKWAETNAAFNLPVNISTDEGKSWMIVEPLTDKWMRIKAKKGVNQLIMDDDYYVQVEKLN